MTPCGALLLEAFGEDSPLLCHERHDGDDSWSLDVDALRPGEWVLLLREINDHLSRVERVMTKAEKYGRILWDVDAALGEVLYVIDEADPLINCRVYVGDFEYDSSGSPIRRSFVWGPCNLIERAGRLAAWRARFVERPQMTIDECIEEAGRVQSPR